MSVNYDSYSKFWKTGQAHPASKFNKMRFRPAHLEQRHVVLVSIANVLFVARREGEPLLSAGEALVDGILAVVGAHVENE